LQRFPTRYPARFKATSHPGLYNPKPRAQYGRLPDPEMPKKNARANEVRNSQGLSSVPAHNLKKKYPCAHTVKTILFISLLG
jgi:hypothetical protein